MTNNEVVATFIEILLRDPEPTMQAIRLRLSATDYELVLKKANSIAEFEKEWKAIHHDEDELYLFPISTAEGQKGVLVK